MKFVHLGVSHKNRYIFWLKIDTKFWNVPLWPQDQHAYDDLRLKQCNVLYGQLLYILAKMKVSKIVQKLHDFVHIKAYIKELCLEISHQSFWLDV